MKINLSNESTIWLRRNACEGVKGILKFLTVFWNLKCMLIFWLLTVFLNLKVVFLKLFWRFKILKLTDFLNFDNISNESLNFNILTDFVQLSNIQLNLLWSWRVYPVSQNDDNNPLALKKWHLKYFWVIKDQYWIFRRLLKCYYTSFLSIL